MRQLFGGILIAVGILIAGASGLCSLWALFSPGGGLGGTLSMLPLILLFGGIPFAVGLGFVFGGWSVIRRARDEGKDADGDVSKISE